MDGPRSRHLCAKLWSLLNAHQREPSVMQVSTMGLDLAKHVFQVHGIDADGRIAVRRKLRRAEVISYFAKLPPVLIGMEACARLTIGGENSARWAIRCV